MTTNGSGILSWSTPSSGGITSLNGLSGATQTFAIGAAGTAPAFSSATTIHTLNIPLASGAGVTSGTISKADYDSFVAKQAALGYTPLNPANNLSDVANAGTARSNLGLGTAATQTIGIAANNVVQLDGTSRLPAVDGSQLTGVVASSIANDAVTSAKILNNEIVNADINSAAAIARTKLASGTNNHVLINDGSGVMSSEANLAVSRGGTGLGSYTNNALIMANGTGTALTNATCAVGEILMWNATTWACTNMAASAQGYFKDGGNTFTGTATLGTNSNHNLEIETNGTTKMTVLANGNVGVGTTTPGSKLDVSSYDTTLYASTGFSVTPSTTSAMTVSNSPTAGAGTDGNSALVYFVNRNAASFDQTAYLGTVSGPGLGTSPAMVFGHNTDASEYSERMRIHSNGNVGIGTTGPTRLLQVAGPMKITPTTVPATPTAGDMYVDSADSNKLKISELEFPL